MLHLICTDFLTELRIERADIDTALLVEFNGSQYNSNFLLKVLRHQSITMPIFQYPSEGEGNLHWRETPREGEGRRVFALFARPESTSPFAFPFHSLGRDWGQLLRHA